jgi:hypothetical protein
MGELDLEEWFEEAELERCPRCEQPTLLHGSVSGTRFCLNCQLVMGPGEGRSPTRRQRASVIGETFRSP